MQARQHLSWSLPFRARGNDNGTMVLEEERPAFLSSSIKCETESWLRSSSLLESHSIVYPVSVKTDLKHYKIPRSARLWFIKISRKIPSFTKGKKHLW